jgi:PAS domain S-box-containing protein
MSPRLLPPGGELRRVLGALSDTDTIVWEADPETGAFVSFSETSEAVLGYPPSAWLENADLWLDRIHPEDRARVRDAWAKGVAEERIDLEYRFATGDDREIWLWQVGQQVRPGGGKPRLRGLLVDVTQRRELEMQRADAVREAVENRTRQATSRWVEAEERFRALEQQIPAITYLDAVDGPQRTLAISEQTTMILGYTPDEWYGDSDLWKKIVHPDDVERLEAAERSATFTGGIEYRMITKDGRTVWVHDRARLITDGQGNPRYWLGVLVDVTDRRRVHELRHELASERAQNLRLSAADEAKTVAMQAVSHDLRTPLAAILGLAATLENKADEMSSEEVRGLASRIVENSRRLDRIVTDLLDLDRLEKGGLTPRLEQLNLGTLVRDLVTRTDAVTERRLQLDTGPVHVQADPTMIERIVENLLANAVKHTPGDSRIWVRVERTDEGALLVVEDDGPGVPEGEWERIFDPFTQGSGAAPGGAGVGLALVARFARLHGGRAWVQERVGGGASFRVLLAYEPTEADLMVLDEPAQPTGIDSSPEESQA